MKSINFLILLITFFNIVMINSADIARQLSLSLYDFRKLKLLAKEKGDDHLGKSSADNVKGILAARLKIDQQLEEVHEREKKENLNKRFQVLKRTIEFFYCSENFNQSALEALWLKLMVLYRKAKEQYPDLAVEIESFAAYMDILNQITIRKVEESGNAPNMFDQELEQMSRADIVRYLEQLTTNFDIKEFLTEKDIENLQDIVGTLETDDSIDYELDQI